MPQKISLLNVFALQLNIHKLTLKITQWRVPIINSVTNIVILGKEMKKIMRTMKISMPIQTNLFLADQSRLMKSERSYLRREESLLLEDGSQNTTTIRR